MHLLENCLGMLVVLKMSEGGGRTVEGGNNTGGDQHIYHCRPAKLKQKWKSQEFHSLKTSRAHTFAQGCKSGGRERETELEGAL